MVKDALDIIKNPIREAGDALKKNAWVSVLESIITIVFGILLVAFSESVVKIVAIIIGVFFVIKGAYQIINYYLEKGDRDIFNNNLLWGVISVLIGAAVLIAGPSIIGVFRIIMGVWLIYSGLVRMNTALKLHTANVKVWRYVLLIALAELLLGIFITFYDGAVVALIGWVLIVSGVISIMSDVMFIQNLDVVLEKVANFGKSTDKKKHNPEDIKEAETK